VVDFAFQFYWPSYAYECYPQLLKKKTKLRGLSPRANYTDRAAAAGRRSKCQLYPQLHSC